MSDREKSQADEEFESGEVSEEDLEQVAGGTTFDVTYVNESNDQNNSQVGIFQKPTVT